MIKKIVGDLKKKLELSIQQNPAQGLLFSGGLDSTILALFKRDLKAITVGLESFGEDEKFANSIASLLNLEHDHIKIDIEEAIDTIPAVIGVLKTFDPAIPNDLVVFFGLKYAKKRDINNVMTGDGADEFFAGYDFMKRMKRLDKYLNRISKFPSFSSNQLGEFFNIKIKQPFLQKEFIHLSLKVPLKYKIRKEKGEIFGKWILRKAFEDKLPQKIIWQQKRPLEVGSGMSRLRQILDSRITDQEFKKKKREYQIKFMSKEHLYYYELYRDTVGTIPLPLKDEMTCPGCGGGMNPNSFHCKICGNVIDWSL